MIRKVVESRKLPGSIGDAGSAGQDLIGYATQDHQHSFDIGQILIPGVDINNTSPDGYEPEVFSDGEVTVPAIYALGNYVAYSGILQNITPGFNPKSSILLTVPLGYRLSASLLPKLFRVDYYKTGVITRELVSMNANHTITWITAPAGHDRQVIELNKIRYLLK